LPGAETRTRTSEAPDLLALNARTWLGSEGFGVGATDRCDGEFARLDQSQPWSNAAGKNPLQSVHTANRSIARRTALSSVA